MELEIFKWIKTLLELGYNNISFIVLIISTLYFLYKYIAKPIGRFILKIISLWNKVEKSVEMLEVIHMEMFPNGGSSLRDAINRIEKRIKLMEEKDRALITSLTDKGYFETDSTGLVTWVSKVWCDITGMIPSEALGNGWVKGIHPDDRERVFEEWEESIKQKRESEVTWKFINSNKNEIIKVKGHSIPLKDDSGNFCGVLGFMEVITKVPINGDTV